MKNKIIPERYAIAFINYCRETLGVEKAVEETKNLKLILSENPQLAEFLKTPGIAVSEKAGVIDAALIGFSEETRQLLKLLLEKGRLNYVNEICDYIRVTYSRGEAVDALLKTTSMLDLDMVQKLKERVEAKFKRRLNLFLELDPDLLGGVQLTVGNTVIDGSIRRRLVDLKKELMKVKV